MSKGLSAEETCIPAWRMAVKNRPITDELIFHSDRGVQYACNAFTNLLEREKLVSRSMSRKGNCWDNAVAESFFKTIKVELVGLSTELPRSGTSQINLVSVDRNLVQQTKKAFGFGIQNNKRI